jgi:hypothetical protein
MSSLFMEEHLNWNNNYELNGNPQDYAFYPHFYDIPHTPGNIQVTNYKPFELHWEDMTQHHIKIWNKQLKPDNVFILFSCT